MDVVQPQLQSSPAFVLCANEAKSSSRAADRIDGRHLVAIARWLPLVVIQHHATMRTDFS